MKFRKSIFAAVILSLLFSLSVQAAGTEKLIFDEAHVLSDEKVAELEDLAQHSSDLTDCVIGFASFEETSENSLMDETKKFFAENIGEDYENICFLAQDVKRNKFVIYSAGTARDLLVADDAKLFNEISDEYADEPEYAAGIEKFIRSSYTMLSGFDLQDAMDFVPVEREYPLVVDEADVLSDEEEKELNELADRIAEEQKMESAVVFVKTLEGKTAEAYADDYYDYNGYGYGEGDDGILLLVAVESRDYATTTHGTGITMFSDYRLEKLEDYFIPPLADNDWAGAAKAFLNQTETFMIQGEPVEEDTDVPMLPPLSFLFFLPVGYLLSGGRMKKHVDQLKTVAIKRGAEFYASGANLTYAENKYVNTTVTRERIKPVYTSSSSSGSSHTGSRTHSTTHHSSSGRSHGGRSGKF